MLRLVLVAFTLAFCLVAVFTGCTANAEREVPKKSEQPAAPAGEVIDVRTPQEYAAGHINGAVLLPYTEAAERIAALYPDKNTPLLLYCRSGRRSAIAKAALEKAGYTRVTDLGSMEQANSRLRRKIVKVETSGKNGK